MAIARQHFPQCDECGKTNIDLWANSNKLALENALKNRWLISEGKLLCPECADKKDGEKLSKFKREYFNGV